MLPNANGIASDLRKTRFDQNGRMLHQTVLKSDLSANYELDYQNGGYDLAGNVTGYRRINHAGGESTDTYVNTLGRSEGYRQERIDVTSTQSASGSSTLGYDANGYLIKVTDSSWRGRAGISRYFSSSRTASAVRPLVSAQLARLKVADGRLARVVLSSLSALHKLDL